MSLRTYYGHTSMLHAVSLSPVLTTGEDRSGTMVTLDRSSRQTLWPPAHSCKQTCVHPQTDHCPLKAVATQ